MYRTHAPLRVGYRSIGTFASMRASIEPVLPNRLRAKPLARPFHIVLVEPEIPPNTGNIARLCAATSCPLHLVGTLGFSIDAHAVRRAGLDYWPLVEVLTHSSLESAEEAVLRMAAPSSPRAWLFSGKAERSYLDVDFARGDGCSRRARIARSAFRRSARYALSIWQTQWPLPCTRRYVESAPWKSSVPGAFHQRTLRTGTGRVNSA